MRDTRTTVALSDTSETARKVYLDRLKEMTPSERLNLAVAFWQAAHSLQRAAVLRDNPHAAEAEITFRIAASRFGLHLARKAYRRT